MEIIMEQIKLRPTEYVSSPITEKMGKSIDGKLFL